MAGRYTDEQIDEVRNAVDLVEIASRYVRLKKSGSGYVACCPFHKEKTPSFHIDPDKQLYHCFGCGAGGSVFQFVMSAEGLDFPDAVKLLADGAGVRLPDPSGDGEDRYRRKREIYAMNKDAARYFRDCLFSDEGAEARAYFQRRALTSKTVASFGLGYSPKGWDGLLKHLQAKGYPRDMIVEAGLCVRNERGHVFDRFRGRVMFPIFDVRGNLIGFAGRKMNGDETNKYVNSPESIVYNKGNNLFALNLARKSRRGYYILVEGYMDVISLHQAGIDCAVAGCGTALTEAQARLLARGNTVYLCYDMDEPGKKARDRAFEIFKGMDVRLRVITIPDGKDADEFVRKYGGGEFEKLLAESNSVTGNRVNDLLARYDRDDVSQKVELINEAAALFAGIQNAVEREAYMRDLSAKTGISYEAIATEVRKAGGRLRQRAVADEVRKSVAASRTAREGSPGGRRESAERRLLGLIAVDAALYAKIADNLDEELFSEGIHRDIFRKIVEIYKDGGDAERRLLEAYRGREEELAAVLVKTDDPQSAAKAAGDYINVIRDEILKERIADAEKAGDLTLLAELLKNNRKAGM